MSFGSNYKFCREHLQIRQSAIADKTGLKQAAIARYEKGENIPSVDTAYALAGAIGVPLDVLMQADITALDIALAITLEDTKRLVVNKGLTVEKVESLQKFNSLLLNGI